MRSDTVPTDSQKHDILNYHPPGPQLSGQIDQLIHVTTVHKASLVHASNIATCEWCKRLYAEVETEHNRLRRIEIENTEKQWRNIE